MPVAATIHRGSLPLIIEGPRVSRGASGVLDSITWEILANTATWGVELAGLGFIYNGKIPGSDYYSMWVVTMDDEPETDLTTLVQVSAIGLRSGGDKRKRRMSVAGREIAIGPDEEVVLAWSDDEQGSEADGGDLEDDDDKVKRRVPKLDSNGDPIYKLIATPLGTNARWNVREAIVVVVDTYFTTTAPNMAVAGTESSPLNAPTPPPYVWGGYTEVKRRNFPKGWVLDDRQVEEHFRVNDAVGLWEVTDTRGYYYADAPD